jgi:pimeloyl-ACP methyl ester carboxylesterase
MSVSYRSLSVDGTRVFFRDAGDPAAPSLLLLHGFPTSSHMFRTLIPELAGLYHVVAPDLPGFGFSDAPPREAFDYTFDHLAMLMGQFTETVGLKRYALYVFDYGAPIGFRLALAHPERVAPESFTLDQPGDNSIKQRVGERECSRIGRLEAGVGSSRLGTRSGQEPSRGVDPDELAGVHELKDRPREDASPTTHVQPAAPWLDLKPRHELVRDQPTPAAHVGFVGRTARPHVGGPRRAHGFGCHVARV